MVEGAAVVDVEAVMVEAWRRDVGARRTRGGGQRARRRVFIVEGEKMDEVDDGEHGVGTVGVDYSNEAL